jgi:hypothetical protein
MALAASLQNVASKIMAKLGGEVTIRRVALSSYNTTTGAVTETNTDVGIRGVLEDVTVREVNELVQAGDKRLIVAAKDLNGTVPTTVDKVLINSVVHQIIRIQTIEQDNTAITYEMILRA